MDETLSRRQATEYVADLIERTHTLEELARRLALVEDYVSEEVPALIKKFADATGTFRTAILAQYALYRRTKKSSDLSLLRSFDRRLQDLFLDLRLPERARGDRVPGVLTRLVAEKAREITPGAGVILRPQWRYNYKIYRDNVQTRYRVLFASIFPSRDAIDEWLHGLPNPLYIISFPLLEQRSIHMHALLGHELGHLVAREFLPPQHETEQFERDLRTQRLSYLRRNRSGQKKLRDEQLLAADVEILDRAMAARRAAIKEYSSDAAAIYLIGLPALLATAQLALSRQLRQGREAEGGTYPTWGNRLFYMLEAAERSGWLEMATKKSGLNARTRAALKAVRAQVSAIRTWVGTSPSWQVSDRWIRMGHTSAERLLPTVRAFIESRFAKCIASPSAAIAALPVLLERLQRSQPPDNLSPSELPFQPASLEQIFLASWSHRLLSQAPVFTDSDIASQSRDAIEQLKRLTFKAVENVDFFSRFKPELEKESVKGGSVGSQSADKSIQSKGVTKTRSNSATRRRSGRSSFRRRPPRT